MVDFRSALQLSQIPAPSLELPEDLRQAAREQAHTVIRQRHERGLDLDVGEAIFADVYMAGFRVGFHVSRCSGCDECRSELMSRTTR